MIATVAWTESKTVLLVLTGDNEKLFSGPPTFAEIPESQIIEAHSPSMVEVKLSTAVRYLACLEAAEEAAKEGLRKVNEARKARIEVHCRKEAEGDVAVIPSLDMRLGHVEQMKETLRMVLKHETS